MAIRPFTRFWLWLLPGGLLLCLLAAGQIHLTGFVDWPHAFLRAAADILPWTLAAPGVFLMAARFPLDRDHWKASGPVHAALVVLCTLGITLLSHALITALPPPAFRPPPPPDFGFHGPPVWWEIVFFRARFHVLVYGVLLLAAHAWSFQREAQERKQRAADLESLLAQARVHQLRAQLQPHFLFNALHAISGLIYTSPTNADEMLATLSELLRRTLRDGERAEVALHEELDVLQLYLDIQHIRFGDRFVVEQHIAAATLNAAVPSFLLQPLVENAVRHGLEKRDRPLHLSLTTRLSASHTEIEILDDGPGLPPDGASRRDGVGLGNTRARLGALYGPAQSFEIRNRPEGGVALLCRIPFHLAPPGPIGSDFT